MANEITVSASLRVSKGNLFEELRKNGLQADMSGSLVEKGVQPIGTSYEAVSIGDVGTPGHAAFVNLDDTNYVEIGVVVASMFYPLVKISPGGTAVFELATGTFYAQADTNTVNLQKFIIEQ